MKTTKSPQLKHALFLTAPHGAQGLRHTEEPSARPAKIGNQLFTLFSVSDDLDRVTMTGEEIDSLCALWMKWKRGNL